MRFALAAIILMGACYDAPQPVCGFLCGPGGACPASYTCSAIDSYCHLDGAAEVSCLPELPPDAFDFFPRIVESEPADGAVDIPLDVIATVKFTEQIANLSDQTFTLSAQGSPTPVAATVAYDAPTRTASLDAADLLAPNTIYVATLTGVTDASDQPLVGPTSWSFTTVPDTTAPTVTVTPAPGSTGVPTDTTLVAEFSEIVLNANPANFLLEGPAGNIPGTISFVSPTAVRLSVGRLAPDTLHTATLTAAITDLAGNPISGAPFTWTFTTGSPR